MAYVTTEASLGQPNELATVALIAAARALHISPELVLSRRTAHQATRVRHVATAALRAAGLPANAIARTFERHPAQITRSLKTAETFPNITSVVNDVLTQIAECLPSVGAAFVTGPEGSGPAAAVIQGRSDKAEEKALPSLAVAILTAVARDLGLDPDIVLTKRNGHASKRARHVAVALLRCAGMRPLTIAGLFLVHPSQITRSFESAQSVVGINKIVERLLLQFHSQLPEPEAYPIAPSSLAPPDDEPFLFEYLPIQMAPPGYSTSD